MRQSEPRIGGVVRRLLAIALVLDEVDRQTLRDWAHRFNAEGIEGLSDRNGNGAKLWLSPKQKSQFVAWVEAGPNPVKDGVVRWRCVDLQACVEGDFGPVMV